MPELLNIKVGSSLSTIGAEGTMRCPLLWKKSRNCLRMSCDVILVGNLVICGFGYSGFRIDESPNQRIHVHAPDSSGYPFAPAFGVKDKNV
jgi:hypothetical protein